MTFCESTEHLHKNVLLGTKSSVEMALLYVFYSHTMMGIGIGKGCIP